MSIKGNAGSFHEIKGSISFPEVIRGKSAYEIAVMHGFEGTEEEWLQSIIDDVFLLVQKERDKSRIGNVVLLASAWEGSESPYSQVVEIADVTSFSQVDLTPSVEQLAIFHQKDLAFVTENDGGVVTVYAIGQKPLNDYVIQATITEVAVQDIDAAVRLGTVNLFASNWSGSESPYSQVVAIAGITENSKVDLTPSVEQLAIFHKKDLAFVTENEGGIVTVYAIGQKPENNYTIQVTISEVEE